MSNPTERRPRLQIERFRIALKPGDKLACSFVPQYDKAASIEETASLLRDLDAVAVRHLYKLETYGRLDMFLVLALEESLMNDRRPYLNLEKNIAILKDRSILF